MSTPTSAASAGPVSPPVPSGRPFRTQHTTPLAEHLEKVMAKRPTARKRAMKSLTPEVFDALQGIPKDTIAAAMLRGCINCHHIVGQKAPPRVFAAMGDELQIEARGVAVRKALGCKGIREAQESSSRKASTYKKLRVEYVVLREHAITVDPWPRDLQARVGAFACDMLLPALPDVIVADGHGIPRMSEQAAWAIEIDLYANPIYEPSAEPPFPWFGFDGIDGDTFVAACRDEKGGARSDRGRYPARRRGELPAGRPDSASTSMSLDVVKDSARRRPCSRRSRTTAPKPCSSRISRWPTVRGSGRSISRYESTFAAD